MDDKPAPVGRIEFSFGSLSFVGEGNQAWLSDQLDKILSAVPNLAGLQPPAAENEPDQQATETETAGEFRDALAAYIKAKGADTNQTKRFLATADWLRRRGQRTLTTQAVTKALANNHQKRLSNPADCLNKNVSKGLCEKTKDGFFITPDGLANLGHK